MDWKSRRVRVILEAALAEDKAAGDLTTAMTIDPKLRGTATITARQACVVAGLGAIPVFLELFAATRVKMGAPLAGRFEVISHPEIFDGVKVKKGQPVAVVRYNAAALLSTERVILNVLTRMSGIATVTRDYVNAVKGSKTRILDTRKTMPGLRMLEKYAVCCGGGVNHRQDLEDGVLIRSGHAGLGGGLGKALENAKKVWARQAGGAGAGEVDGGAGGGDCGGRGGDFAGCDVAGDGEAGSEDGAGRAAERAGGGKWCDVAGAGEGVCRGGSGFSGGGGDYGWSGFGGFDDDDCGGIGEFKRLRGRQLEKGGISAWAGRKIGLRLIWRRWSGGW